MNDAGSRQQQMISKTALATVLQPQDLTPRITKHSHRQIEVAVTVQIPRLDICHAPHTARKP